MAVIKTLTHLSLYRPSSDPAAGRTTLGGSAATLTTTPAATPPVPQPPTMDYHLPDENLVTYEGRRSRSHGGSSRKADAALASPPIESPGTTGLPPKQKRHLSLGPSLSGRGKVRSSSHSTAATSHATANGSAVTPNGSHPMHRPLLAGLLSANSKTSLTVLTGGSPAGTPATSPSGGVPHAKGKAGSMPPVGQGTLEASHVGKVGSRLRELVNKTFPSGPVPGPTHAGRGAPRIEVAAEVGELLRTELIAAKGDPYVLRSLVRTAVAPALTVFITRLDQLLVRPSDDASLLFVPKTVRDVDASLPPVLQFDIEVVKAAWLVRSALDDVLRADEASAAAPRGLVDGLAPFVGKLDAIVQKLMGPYLATAKSFIMAKIATFRLPDPAAAHAPSKSTLPMTLTRSSTPTPPSTSSALPHGAPLRLRELACNLDALRKLFLVRLACGADSDKWIVSVASQAVWKGMLAFAARTAPLQLGPKMPPSPPRAHTGAGRGFLKSAQRSPSPTHRHALLDEHIGQKEVLNEIASFSLVINKFIEGIAGLPEAISMIDRCPGGANCVHCKQGISIKLGDDGDLVRDAMNEALEALSASQLVLRAAARANVLVPALTPPAPLTVSAAFAGSKEAVVTPPTGGCPTLDRAVDELPPLILLHALASRLSKEVGFRLPHEIWEDSWEDYEGELRGFVAAEQWTQEIATTMIAEVERVKKESEGRLGEKDLETLATIELVARLNSSPSL